MPRLDKLEAAVADLKERVIKAEAWDGGCAIDWMSPEDAKKIRTLLEYHRVWDGPRPSERWTICKYCGSSHDPRLKVCPHCGE